VISFLVMTKNMEKTDVIVARITMSRRLRTSSATGTVPVWANSQLADAFKRLDLCVYEREKEVNGDPNRPQ
jgi:hypothetical protein